jgi:EmrB/QacA subfamily drug resistance transporter
MENEDVTTTDRATDAATPETQSGASMETSGRGRWLGLMMLSLGVSMIIVDATIVNVAVPSIIRDLDLDLQQAEWINTIYALVFAAFLVTFGRIGDVLGRRIMYLGGLVLFIAASVLAGLAQTGEMLIIARFLQGLGGAAILPATQSILNSNFRGRDRAIAFGIWGSVIGGMAAVGPLIGGWLTTYLSWRWAFFINVPIGIIAIIGTLVYIRESRDEHARAGFDLPGFVLITAGLSAIVFGLIEGQTYGWLKPKEPFTILGWTWPSTEISIIPVLIVGGILALLLFSWVEIRRERAGKFYLFDFGLWRYPSFRYGNLAGTIVSLGEFGLLFVIPLFLQAVLGFSAFDTGLLLMSLAAGAFVAAPLAAQGARRYGPRRVVTVGMGMEAVGILVTTLLIGVDVNALLFVPPLFIYGIGVGFATAQLTSIVLGEIPPEKSGLASGTNSTMRQVGSALGIAIVGTVLAVGLGTGVRTQLQEHAPQLPSVVQEGFATAIESSAGQAITVFKGDPAAIAGSGTVPAEFIPFLTTPEAKPVLEAVVAAGEHAFVDAARMAGFVALGFVLLGVLFSLLLPKEKREHVVERVGPTEPLPVVVPPEA